MRVKGSTRVKTINFQLHRSSRFSAMLTVCIAMFPSVDVHADLDFSGQLIIDGQARIVDDDTTAAVGNQLFLDGTGLEIDVALAPAVTLYTTTVFESVVDFDYREDVHFDGHGAFVQEVFLQYEKDRFAVFGGKYNVNFGTAWDITPGLFRKAFAGEYEFTERIGFGGQLSPGSTDFGDHTVSVGVGFVDTSILSDSIIERRGRTTSAHGGPGNTSRLDSYNVTIDGEDAAGVMGLNYHVAYTRQSRRSEADGDLSGYAIAVRKSAEFARLSISGMVEWAEIRGLEPGLNTTTFVTPAVEGSFDAVSAAVIYSKRESRGLPEEDFIEISIGYTFDSGLKLNLSWAEMDLGSGRFRAIGTRFVYSHQL